MNDTVTPLPSAPDSEQALIVASLTHDDAQARVAALPDDAFLHPQWKRIHGAMRRVRAEHVKADTFAIVANLREHGELDAAGGEDEILNLVERYGTGSERLHLDTHLGKVQEARQLRAYILMARDLEARIRPGVRSNTVTAYIRQCVSEIEATSNNAVGFPVLNAGDLMASTATDNLAFLPFLGQDRFIVRGWSHVLAAFPKTGKTELLAAIIRSWPEERILYLTEEPQSVWLPRLRRHPGAWENLRLGFPLGEHAAAILAATQNADATVIVIDTLRLFGIVDENDNGAVSLAVTPFRLVKLAAGKVPSDRLLGIPRSKSSAMFRADADKAKIVVLTTEGRATWHSLRKSFVNAVLRSGADMKTAMDLARHSTAQMTMETYATADEGRIRAAAHAAAEHLQGATAVGRGAQVVQTGKTPDEADAVTSDAPEGSGELEVVGASGRSLNRHRL